mgnify:CR=1 FL=1
MSSAAGLLFAEAEEAEKAKAAEAPGVAATAGCTCGADAGAGVPPDFLPRLFERFSRAERESEPGTGLGLHLARRLCRIMGGDLGYLPPEGDQGPRFVVSLAAG